MPTDMFVYIIDNGLGGAPGSSPQLFLSFKIEFNSRNTGVDIVRSILAIIGKKSMSFSGSLSKSDENVLCRMSEHAPRAHASARTARTVVAVEHVGIPGAANRRLSDLTRNVDIGKYLSMSCSTVPILSRKPDLFGDQEA